MNLLHSAAGALATLKSAMKEIASDAAAELIAATADMVLLIDAEGLVSDVAFTAEQPRSGDTQDWLGRPWSETVTPESKAKIEALLTSARAEEAPRWRQVNHPVGGGDRAPDLPVMYAAAACGSDGRVLAVGRDLRALAELQQRLLEAQRTLERDYARLRHAETRYRLLFELTTEPVLVLNAGTLRIAEANAAAQALAKQAYKKLVGRAAIDLFAPDQAAALRSFFAGARARNAAAETSARLSPKLAAADAQDGVVVGAAAFRQERANLILVRLAEARPDGAPSAAAAEALALARAIEASPEAMALTDLEGRVRTVNAAFLDLAEMAASGPAIGEKLERWLGRSGVDMPILLAALRDGQPVRAFATMLRGQHGALAEVEISAAVAEDADPPTAGFLIRHAPRAGADGGGDPEEIEALPKSVSEVTELVGRAPLKDIVRETTDAIERLCIETALELTGDNRASAAEMLGLSRQSLYVKLRRYGLGELDGEGA